MANNTFVYNGPVKSFGRVINPNYTATTIASSEKKALSNIAYQYKRQRGLLASSRIDLPGKIIMTE